jgi:7-keto-8-aminopelargonate synthetase-like enzyme
VAAFDIMVDEPDRLRRLRANGQAVADALRAVGVDVGLSAGPPVVPALIGDTRRTMVAAQALLAAGINANPIMYPAVAEGEGRLRFFVTAEHTAEQIERTAQVIGGFLRS